MNRMTVALRCMWACLGILAGESSKALAVDREVGVGKPFASISAAMAAASGGDRIVVFSGTYDEQIAWTKAVDIVEAPGAAAALRPTDAISGVAPLFLVDITLGSASAVTWDGIDLVNDSTKFSRFFMERGGDAGAVVNIKNISVTDTPTAEGFGRVFSAETGTLNLENVFVNMSSTAGLSPGYEIGVGAFGAGVTVRAVNCVFATPGGALIHGENQTASMIFESCVLNRKPGPNGFLADLGDGSYTFNDCFFTAADNTTRGILTRGGSARTIIELNRCRFDPNVQWRAIQTEKATELTCTNCCFPSSSNEGFFMLHNNAHLGAGDASELTFTHCTFSFAGSGNTSGIRDESVGGSSVTYNVDNCLFHIPGSSPANGAIHGNTQGGTVEVFGTDNFVFSDSDPPAAGLLTGSIEPATPEDPKLSTIDHCHIVDASSPAIDFATSVAVTDDIDKDPRDAQPDYGCDELTGTAPPAPQPPARVLAVPGGASVKLGWNPPSSGAPAVAYNVFRTRPLPAAKLNALPITGLDLTLIQLQNGVEHCFQVRSVGVFGAESVDSVEVCATPEGGSGVIDLEVGPGREFATIQAAITAARGDGKDRVLVYTGEYDEAILIQKQVDIVEAPGEEAVLRLVSPLPALSFVVELVGLGNYAVTWDGIDVQYDLEEGPRRMFLARFNSAGTVMNFKNMKITDTETSGGGDMRFFSNELTGSMNLENVTVDLVADTSDYQMILSSHVGTATVTAKNCLFRARIGGRMLYTELGRSVKLTADNCEIDNLGRGSGGMIGQFTDGTIELNDCLFKGERASRGLVCESGGRNTILRVNRCTWDPSATWIPVQLEKNLLEATFTNCCIASNPNGDPSNPFSILVSENSEVIGGDLSNLTLRHCTLAMSAENPANTGILYRAVDGNVMELTVENCIFHLPGSTAGAVQKDSSAGGSIDMIAGKNLRFISPGVLASDDELEADPAGVIVEDDPGLEADLCHIEPPSGALNAGANIGVNNDIDGETRPEAGVDLGADEFSGTPAPSCPITNLVCNAGEAIELLWGTEVNPPECRCASIEVRDNATGAVLATVAGNVTQAQLQCEGIASSGTLAVVCIGPDGTEKQATCDYQCASSSPRFHRGDADDNGALELTDAIRVLGFLFLGGPAPTCIDAADADDNGRLELTDAVRILGYLFLGGSPPAPPGPPPEACGIDPSADGEGDLGCASYVNCP